MKKIFLIIHPASFFIYASAFGIIYSTSPIFWPNFFEIINVFPQFLLSAFSVDIPDDGSSSVIYATITNVIVVLIFSISSFLYIFRTHKWHFEAHKNWADNTYYLGFIYTLVSLIVALGSTGEDISSSIVQNAIALASTAAALFLRTLWLMLVEANSPISQYEVLEKEMELLTQGIRDIRLSAKDVANQLQQSKTEVDSAIKQSITDFSGSVISQGEIQTQNIQKTFEQLQVPFDQFGGSLKALTDAISSVKITDTTVSEKIAAAIFSSLEELRNGLNSINTGLSESANEINVSAAGIANALSESSFQDAIAVAAKDALQPLKEASNLSQHLGSELVSDANVIVDQLFKQIQKFKDITEQSAAGLKTNTQQLNRQKTAIMKSLGALDEKLENAVASAANTEQVTSFKEMLDDLNSNILGLIKALEASKRRASRSTKKPAEQ